MYFYKYLKADILSISMLRHGEVFFASPHELNDIHECKPQFIFNANAEVWSKFIDDILAQICFKLNFKQQSELPKKIFSLKGDLLLSLLKKRKKKSVNYNTLLIELTDAFGTHALEKLDFLDAWNAIRALNSYLQNDLDSKLNNSYYMTSFSKSATNLTMWGHYGNAEKGFAIIYESEDGSVNIESDIDKFPCLTKTAEHSYLIGISKRSTTQLIEVVYKNKPVRANGFTGIIPKFHYTEQESDNDYPETLLASIPRYNEDEIGRIKFTDWKYEKELRLHLPVYEKLDAPFRSVRICSQHIKGVILGSRISLSDKNNILAALYYLRKSQDMQKDIFVFQANNAHGQYKINVNTLGKISDLQFDKIPFLEKINKHDIVTHGDAEKINTAINES
ncbi:DUF2971 domain-containing protein [Enterobacter soli]|uniref:DUF2971 domain-containing protein n=1 Tax=Enterobacter soli TaxID=885040 RepID=UPI003EDB201B